jgi:hypothetical protein
MNAVIYDTKEKILAQLKHCGLERIIRRREIQALLTAFDTRLQLERRLNIAVEGLTVAKQIRNFCDCVPEDGYFCFKCELADSVDETLDKINGTTDGDEPKPQTCQSDRDGDCDWKDCPQLRDGEPVATGRSCPLYDWEDVDERR